MFLVERADLVYRRRVDHRPLQSLTFEQIAHRITPGAVAQRDDDVSATIAAPPAKVG